jgi:histone-lysine N-methyltransferase SETMAR
MRREFNFMSQSKGSQRLCIAKRTMSVNQGPAIQISVRKGKSVNAKFYKGNVLYKLKKISRTADQQATGLRGVSLLQDNAHKAAIEREYLKQENVVDISHPPFSPDLAP